MATHTPVFLPRESHGQRSLAVYSPWGHKEWDITEQLSMHTGRRDDTVLGKKTFEEIAKFFNQF